MKWNNGSNKMVERCKIGFKGNLWYIAIDSKRYARFQVEKIILATAIIKSQPEIGKIIEEIEIPNLWELVEGNYRIIDINTIHILLVHHVARDLHQRIKKSTTN